MLGKDNGSEIIVSIGTFRKLTFIYQGSNLVGDDWKFVLISVVTCWGGEIGVSHSEGHIDNTYAIHNVCIDFLDVPERNRFIPSVIFLTRCSIKLRFSFIIDTESFRFLLKFSVSLSHEIHALDLRVDLFLYYCIIKLEHQFVKRWIIKRN